MSKVILITNDDGYDARGIQVLAQALEDLGEVWIVAPATEQSASAHSLTLRSPIEVEPVGERRFKIHGTPTDSVVLGINGILKRNPDLLVSGINHGPNMGEDVTYSGTVAAAIEGTILGVPSLAISSLQRGIESTPELQKIARVVVEKALDLGVPEDCLLNVNIPNPEVAPIEGFKITKLGSRAYENILEEGVGRDGQTAYTIGGDAPVWKDDDGTDIAAIRAGHVSITPLHLDLTHYKTIVEMERWRFPL
jgi:5'-nucleotidase